MIRFHGSDERITGKGFNLLGSLELASDEFPSELASDYHTCPFAYSGCLGAKDPGFEGTCSGKDFPYLQCDLYEMQNQDIQIRAIGDSRRRAVNPNGKHKKAVSLKESIHDAIAEGVNASSVQGIGIGTLRHTTGYDTSMKNLWPEWNEELDREIRV